MGLLDFLLNNDLGDVILNQLLNVSVQLANKRGLKKDSVRTSRESHNVTTTK
jgi:hypothetical protein